MTDGWVDPTDPIPQVPHELLPRASTSMFARFESPGDYAQGFVLHYDPQNGAADYNGDPCGVLILQVRNEGQVWIRLASRRIQKAVAHAAFESNSRYGGFRACKVTFTSEDASGPGYPAKEYRCQYAPVAAERMPALQKPREPEQRDRRSGGNTGYVPPGQTNYAQPAEAAPPAQTPAQPAPSQTGLPDAASAQDHFRKQAEAAKAEAAKAEAAARQQAAAQPATTGGAVESWEQAGRQETREAVESGEITIDDLPF